MSVQIKNPKVVALEEARSHRVEYANLFYAIFGKRCMGFHCELSARR